MAENEMQAPKFNELVGGDLTADNDVFIQFLTADGRRYRIEINRPIIGAVVTMLIGLLNKTPLATLDPSRRQSDPIMSLRLTAARPTTTQEGGPALALVFEDAIELGVELAPGAGDGLRNALRQAEDAAKPPEGEPKH